MELARYAKNYKIFMDTCTILQNPHHVDLWLGAQESLLKAYGQKINIPLRVIEEIKKHSLNEEKYALAQNAKEAYRILGRWQWQGLIEICGDSRDNFADNAFLVAFTQLRIQNNLLLITQDKKLALDILRLNDTKSVHGKDVDVLFMNPKGVLQRMDGLDRWHTRDNGNAQGENAKAAAMTAERLAREKFSVASQVTDIPDEAIRIAVVPDEGDVVYTKEREAVRLGKKLAAGGEGTIYDVDASMVGKIYKQGKLTKRKYAKLELMLSHKLKCPGICFPEKALYNAQKEFVGYLMPKASGVELQRSIFTKPLFLKRFPHWKKIDQVQCAMTILQKVKYLHDRNILIGDINPCNVLVASPTEVYLVDTDSFQVEGYPCPVGTPLFTAKEIQGIRYEARLRTRGNENFALATLLFMLMVPGKAPYSHQGGEGIINNIKKQAFPYPLGAKKGEHLPAGAWRFIWSHLTWRLKEAFFETFHREGKYASENMRLNVDEWIDIVRDYYNNLANGNLGSTDRMSEELFPTRFKKEKFAAYEPCIICGRETKKRWGDEYTICYDCSQKVIATLACADCGKEFTVTQGEKLFLESKGKKLPDLCKECRKRRKFGFSKVKIGFKHWG